MPQNKLYDSNVVTIKRFNEEYRITWNKSMRIKGMEEVKDNVSRETLSANVRKELPVLSQAEKYRKFSESLIRAKSKVREYILCNEFSHFVTLTADPSKFRDRFDVKSVADKVTQTISNYNKREGVKKGFKVTYVLIPEKHPTSGAIHFHGFMNLPLNEIRINKNGYPEWGVYADKCGFMSISILRDKNRAASYIAKYMAKDMMSTTLADKGSHAYYASKGLNKAMTVYQGHAEFMPDIEWDWMHPDGYCAVKTLTPGALRSFVKDLFPRGFLRVENTPFDPPEFIDVKVLYENKKTIDKLLRVRYNKKCKGDVPLKMNYISYNRRERK